MDSGSVLPASEMCLLHDYCDKSASGKIWNIGNGPKMKGHLQAHPAKCVANSNDFIDRSYSNASIRPSMILLMIERTYSYLFLLFWHNFKLTEHLLVYILLLSPTHLFFTFHSICFISLSFYFSPFFHRVRVYVRVFVFFQNHFRVSCRHHKASNWNPSVYIFSEQRICLYDTVIEVKICRTDIMNKRCTFNFFSSSNNVNYSSFPLPVAPHRT